MNEINKPFLDTITESSGCTLEEYRYVYSRLLENYKIKWNDFEETGFIAKEIKNHSQNLEMYENKIEEITDYEYRKEHFRTHEVFLSTYSYFEKIIASHKAILKFLETKKSELEAPQPPTPPEDDTSEDKQENQFAKNIPMQFTIEHFSKLKKKNKKGNVFLTDEKFDKFIKCAFLNEKIIEKQKIDFERGESGKVIGVFYDYFDLACKDYGQKNSKEPFINLVFKCFDNWEITQIKSFFKPNKTKDIL